MNERILELKEQATVETPIGHGIVKYVFSPEKFAELIVREMLQTCEDHPAWTGRMIGEKIKQHFGVE